MRKELKYDIKKIFYLYNILKKIFFIFKSFPFHLINKKKLNKISFLIIIYIKFISFFKMNI